VKTFAKLLAPVVTRTLVKKALETVYAPGTPAPSTEVVDAYLTPYAKNSDGLVTFVAAIETLTDKTLIQRIIDTRVRTLILWGRHDRIIPLKHGESLHKKLAGSQFFVHPDIGHHPQEEAPQWVADHIKTFLRPIV
jgi:pimeloyl-ACP methyl ester carboxylesterase